MIVADTSALLAIVFGEPEREGFLSVIEAAERVLVASVSVVEARMVLHARRGADMVKLFDRFLALPQFEVVSPDQGDIEAAHAAFLAYGKGSGHPTRLNFGDLFSYALAKSRGLPLLFKGDDFALTDLESALVPPADQVPGI